MWLLILIVAALIFGGVLSVLGGGIRLDHRRPGSFLAAAVLVAWFIRHRSDTDAPQVVPPPREPTGTPRSASGTADTANKRVGQS
jgi:hypothetical protein